MKDPVKYASKLDFSRRPASEPEIGPTQLTLNEWAALGLEVPDLGAMREYRLSRIVSELVDRDLGGLLCFDPLNIRYITDCSNMQLWITHNPVRAVFVAASGYVILWDFHGCAHLSAHLPLVREVRSGAGALVFDYGEGTEGPARRFATEVAEVLRAHSGMNRRLAVDRADGVVLFALQAQGLEIAEGQIVTEMAREIKSADEIKAIRCAIAACDASVAEMHAALQPGMSENELWSYLHAGNIKRGGEWIETRLLSSGPRTNPWYQECGSRIIRDGDLVAFDTDLIGCYGYCVDYSRTWFVGNGKASDEQRQLYAIAFDHIQQNGSLMLPGRSLREVTDASNRLPEAYRAQRYSALAHGVGLCDEYPCIRYPEDVEALGCDDVLRPGQVFSVEAYVGAEGASQGIKLEDMLLITETGNELLTHYPFDAQLSA